MTRKRRAHGEGEIVRRGEGTWRLRYYVNNRRFSKTVHGTDSEAKKAMRALLTSGDTGEHVAPDKISLAEWAKSWIAIGAPGRRRQHGGRRTVERYEELLRCHVLPIPASAACSNCSPHRLIICTSRSKPSWHRGRCTTCMRCSARVSMPPCARACWRPIRSSGPRKCLHPARATTE
jgi:hypothetical protein